MTLSDFMSRINVDNADPGEIIPVSFSIQEVLNAKFNIETRAKIVATGTKPHNIHRFDEKFDPYLKPEKQRKPQVYYQDSHLK